MTGSANGAHADRRRARKICIERTRLRSAAVGVAQTLCAPVVYGNSSARVNVRESQREEENTHESAAQGAGEYER